MSLREQLHAYIAELEKRLEFFEQTDMAVVVSQSQNEIEEFQKKGGFTADAEREIRSSSKHIEAMDLDRLIKLWQQYYEQIREAGKLLLPMVKLFFLAPPEE